MPRTIRNQKLDTRSARSKLKNRKSGYWAPVVPGCAVGYRKGPKGGVWLAKFVRDGLRRETTIGTADDVLDADGSLALSFAQAQERARKWFANVVRDTVGEPDPTVSYRVAEILDDYLADYRRRGGKAVRDLEIRIDRIKTAIGAVTLDQLTAKRIREWHASLAETAPRARTGKRNEKQNYRSFDPSDPDVVRSRRATANRNLTVLKAALNHAFHERRASSDTAWRSVRPFREVDAARVRYLSHDEARRLVNAADPAFRPLIQCALLTGCRYGEIIRFRVSDFEHDSGTVHVRTSKSGKGRHVVLAEEGSTLLTDHTAGKVSEALIFTRPDGGPWGRSHQRRPLIEACDRAKITPAASFHILRHTYASHLVQAGAPLQVVAANLGHADTRMTERHYAHLAPSYVASVIRSTMPKLGLVERATVTAIRR